MTILRSLARDRWLIELPLPGHGIGHVNVVVMAVEDGITLIDSGWGDEDVWNRLTDAIQTLGSRIERVSRLVTTHYHADHCGASRMFQMRTGATVTMHRADAANIDDRYISRTPYVAETLAWIDEVGAPTEIRHSALAQVDELGGHVIPFVPDRVIHGADTAADEANPEVKLIHTPGHTAGHICVFDARTGILATGDALFARINTSPVLRPQSTDNPVGDYLNALDLISSLPARLVVPGHLEPFTDLDGRIAQVREYHRRRLDEVLQLVRDTESTVWEVASLVRRRRPWAALSEPARTTATAETHAHLRHLEINGRIIRQDANGAVRWTAT